MTFWGLITRWGQTTCIFDGIDHQELNVQSEDSCQQSLLSSSWRRVDGNSTITVMTFWVLIRVPLWMSSLLPVEYTVWTEILINKNRHFTTFIIELPFLLEINYLMEISTLGHCRPQIMDEIHSENWTLSLFVKRWQLGNNHHHHLHHHHYHHHHHHHHRLFSTCCWSSIISTIIFSNSFSILRKIDIS